MSHFKKLGDFFAQLAIDLVLISASVYLAFFLCMAERPGSDMIGQFAPAFFYGLPVMLAVYALCFCVFGVYSDVWKFSTVKDLVRIVSSVFIAVLSAYFFGLAVDSVMPGLVYAFSSVLMVLALLLLRRGVRKLSRHLTKTAASVPPLSDPIDGELNMRHAQNVRIEDLLGREPIRLDIAGLSHSVQGKTVLVTGGGGSIGSELCRKLALLGPKKLIILDIYENNAYEIQNELKRNYPDLPLEVRIASVRDEKKLGRLFEEFHPQLVFHAAAHKHVPLMEDAPDEAVKNNIFGTLNTVKMADRYGVERFVLISTDKSVRPTNVMGATKRVCEMIVQTYDRMSETEFVAVRFGNVLGSNGSVIPLFEKQIEAGGPVTVTHQEILRYFMTIPEAVSLILQAGAFAKGGEIFVLDMGKPVRIVSLAENLIRLSGYVPGVDIKIEFTGLRPGEKLYEELLMDEEGLEQTENKLIHIGKPIALDQTTFFEELEALRITAENGGDVIPLLKRIAPTFQPRPTQTV